MSKSWRPNRGKRIDSNQTAIVNTLRSIPGITVLHLNNTIDICVGYWGKNWLFEIKRNAKSKFRDSQIKFFNEWNGQINRVETVDQILEVIGAKQRMIV